MAARETKEAWVAGQMRTFTKWVNNHLRKKGYSLMDNIETEFEDGIKLMEIINSLYGVPLPPKFNKTPKLRPHKLDNISLAFEMVEAAKVKTNFLKTTHLIDHDLKMILGMVWSLILDYAIKGISEENQSAKEGLLLWCRKKTANYSSVDPPGLKNFSQDWRNGLAFCALIHKHMPHLLDYDSLNKDNHEENLELAFSVAEKELGIPRLLDVEDVNVDRPDEKSVMTYVAEYYHKFASHSVKETAARRAVKFLNFTRAINTRKTEYERRSADLLEWIDQTINGFTDFKFGETLADAQEAQGYQRNFVVLDKPARAGEKLDLETIFAEIQTELKVNDRAAYTPSEGLGPEDIEAAWERLWDAEKKFAVAVREQRFRFIKKEESKIAPEKIAEFEESFNHFDADKNGTLSASEFKAALSSLGFPFPKDDDGFNAFFNKHAEGGESISLAQYIGFLTILHEDRDTPEQLKESFKVIADGADIITAEQLNVPPLTEDDVKFLTAEMPVKEPGYDYIAYVDSNFVSSSE